MGRAPVVIRWVFAGTVLLGLAIWLGSWRLPTGTESGRELHFADRASQRTTATLCVATWNIHGARGRDGVVDLERIARRLRSQDFVGLNEVRGGSTWWQPDQAEKLAQLVQSGWLFLPYERRWGLDDFGNGVLSVCKVVDWIRLPLPHSRSKGHGNLTLLTLDVSGTAVRVIVTHIDHRVDRTQQLQAVCNLFLSLSDPVILMGDLNSSPDDPQLAGLLANPGVYDVLSIAARTPPPERVDWILVRGLKCVRSGIEDQGESDHPLIWAEFQPPGRSSGDAPSPPGAGAEAVGAVSQSTTK